jgi:predicted Zn-dependent protease
LEQGGQRGVDALSAATPVRTGKTASSWAYRIGHEKGRYFIEWYNTHIEEGVNIAVIIQYGHATGTGGYVTGINYINPALEGVFNDIAADVWREVTRG